MPRLKVTPVKCQHCAATMRVPDLPGEARREVIELVRARHLLAAVFRLETVIWRQERRWRFIPEKFRVPKTSFKTEELISLLKHMTLTRGLCWKCNERLPEGQQDCLACHAFNLDW